jgi:hypothetical protein
MLDALEKVAKEVVAKRITAGTLNIF